MIPGYHEAKTLTLAIRMPVLTIGKLRKKRETMIVTPRHFQKDL